MAIILSLDSTQIDSFVKRTLQSADRKTIQPIACVQMKSVFSTSDSDALSVIFIPALSRKAGRTGDKVQQRLDAAWRPGTIHYHSLLSDL